MKRIHRFVLLAMVALLTVAIVSPATATEAGSNDEAPATTVAAVPEGEGPAVEAPAVEPERAEQPWTARFIYPVLILVTILLLAWLGIWYNRNIRKKYQVIG